MTDTDDTDELLLIPPDFFAIESDSAHSETVQPYYNIVDNLIKQVGNLQNRLKSIETSESFCSNSLDCSSESLQKMEHTRQHFRKYNSTDDLCTSQSAQSSPQKPCTRFKLNSLPNSPNIDRFFNPRNSRVGLHTKLNVNESVPDVSSKKYTRSGKDGQVLQEIDTFLSKVKTIQRINAARNLENDFNNYEILKSDQFQNSNISGEKKNPIVKQKVWQSEDNRGSVPDYEAGLRETLYDQNKIQEELDIQSPNVENLGETVNFTKDSLNFNQHHSLTDTSSDSTQVTAYNRPREGGRNNLLTNPIHSNALNVLNIHKKLLEDSSKKPKAKENVGGHKQRSKHTIVGDNLGTHLSLMNLADIWNSSNQSLTESQLTQKLQEEKYRRKHCEDLIQELQTRNLELQQNMSVAVKVDDAKNITIKKYQDALEKLIYRLEKLSKEKIDQEFEINKLKNLHIDEKEDADQKIAYYEKEVSRVQNLAKASQDKITSLEKRCLEFETENQSVSKKLKLLEQDYSKECDKYKQMSEILAQKEIELNENKTTLSNARSEITQSRQAVELCQTEFNRMKDSYNQMENNLTQERDQKAQLNKKILDLAAEMESYKKQQNGLQEELAKSKKQLDSNKVELRNFYQGQVEILVQNKLKEFQCQLDETENKFKDEVSKREMSIAKSAASHIQQISDKYSQEIKLIEKKHQEESKLYQIQIMRHKELVDSLQRKLDQFQEKQIAVAKQLKTIMESQWNEALRIITSGKSPTSNDESSFSTIDQLNYLKTKSYNNFEEVLSQHGEDHFEVEKPKKNCRDETASTTSNHHERPSHQRFVQLDDTPVSSRISLNRALTGTDMQQFLSLLSNKPSGNPSQEDVAKESENMTWDAYIGLPCFQDKDDGSQANLKGQHKERKGLKPPWK